MEDGSIDWPSNQYQESTRNMLRVVEGVRCNMRKHTEYKIEGMEFTSSCRDGGIKIIHGLQRQLRVCRSILYKRNWDQMMAFRWFLSIATVTLEFGCKSV